MLKKLLYALLFLTISLQATVPTERNIAKLYVATFNRAPDASGLKYWVNASEFTLEEIAQSFFDQPETQQHYPEGYSNQEFVEAIYHNLFGRTPDEAGAQYWINALETGKVDRSIFILAAINGALGDDAVILDNKTTVGLAFAHAGMNHVDDAIEIMRGIDASSSSVQAALEKFGITLDIDTKEKKDDDAPAQSSAPLTPTPAKPKVKVPTTQKGWYIRIQVEANGLEDANTVFGYLKGASDNKDRYDSEAMASSGLYSVIYHDDFGKKTDYRSDYRAYKKSGQKTETWILKVKYAKDKHADVTLKWNGITYTQGISGGGFIETHKSSSSELDRMRLVDVSNGDVIDISTEDSYRFNMDGKTTHEFQWIMLADGEEEPNTAKAPAAQSRMRVERMSIENKYNTGEHTKTEKAMRFDPPFE